MDTIIVIAVKVRMDTIIVTVSLGLGIMSLLGKSVHIIWHIDKPAASAQGYIPFDVDR